MKFLGFELSLRKRAKPLPNYILEILSRLDLLEGTVRELGKAYEAMRSKIYRDAEHDDGHTEAVIPQGPLPFQKNVIRPGDPLE
jgi:hypothetical protein